MERKAPEKQEPRGTNGQGHGITRSRQSWAAAGSAKAERQHGAEDLEFRKEQDGFAHDQREALIGRRRSLRGAVEGQRGLVVTVESLELFNASSDPPMYPSKQCLKNLYLFRLPGSRTPQADLRLQRPTEAG
jgi:hypothetical protein